MLCELAQNLECKLQDLQQIVLYGNNKKLRQYNERNVWDWAGLPLVQ
jgi:hypothetical protein